MSLYIVDASVVVKWFFDEAHTEAAVRLLDDAHHLHAPDFYLLEVENVVCKRIRRRQITRHEADQVRQAVRRFPIQTHPFDALLEPAFEFAAGTGRSLYDCLYVALAALLGGPVVTADRRLYEALSAGPFARYVAWVGDVASNGAL